MRMSLSAVMLLVAVCVFAGKKAKILSESRMKGYVMVYHKDADHGLHMAYSHDGYVWTALNEDRPIMGGDTISVQKGIRDPHIFRSPKGGFCVAMTDLHVFGMREGYRTTQWERDEKKYLWGNNRGLVLLKSDDMINWKRTNLDFSLLKCPTGMTDLDGTPIPWSEVGCVWAPEMVWDDAAGKIMMHFTTRFKNGKNCIYYAYMNDDFTELASEPKLLFCAPRDENGDLSYNIIDSDIIKVGDTYHLFCVGHDGKEPIKHATASEITGPYVLDNKYNDGENRAHEAPNCWKRIGKDEWVVMFDNFAVTPHNFGFVETTDFEHFTPIGYFDQKDGKMSRTNFSEQKHGAVVAVTHKEIDKLVKYWKKKVKTK